ncbi:YgiT-type zinc finger protein [Piscinibacter sp.]|jgi:YgiT-type zinc finger domain-containing protein|uniref:YgiT-type zinc finger protein n=1 Tax=Piscinibacter sp. TaxID=1903157 RepID=UPI003559B8EA
MEIDEVLSFSCSNCGSVDVHASRVRSAFWQDDRLVVVVGIPALVCNLCGEQFYDDATAIGLDLLRGDGFPPEAAVHSMEVPVFEFGKPRTTKNLT